MSTEIKIVPNASPNADGEWITVPGEWITVPGDLPRAILRNWLAQEAAVAPHVPAGFHVVAISGGGSGYNRTVRAPAAPEAPAEAPAEAPVSE